MDQILKDLSRRFDHSALKADVDEKEIIKLCDEAKKFNFLAVCVNPVWVKTASELLHGSNTHIVSTAGFPLGANRTDIKSAESAKAVSDGATEIDMVANIGWIKSGEFKKVETEIAEIRRSIPFNAILKVIIEAPLLNGAEQNEATKAVVNGGAQFVKSGTGFAGDVTVEQIINLRNASGGKVETKAAGGIRILNQCRMLLQAGATRLGSSSTVQIMQELQSA